MNFDATQILRRTVGCAPIVGRGRELAVIDLERESALQGTPRALLLSGEPGIGTTRLLRAVCERGMEDCLTVLMGFCVEEQADRARLSWRYSEWLREEAERLGISTIAARPWDSGFERALALL